MLKFTEGEWKVDKLPYQYNGIEGSDGDVWCTMTGKVICDKIEIADINIRVNEPGEKIKVSNAKEFRSNLALIAASPKLYKLLSSLTSQLSVLESEDFKLSFSGELAQTISESISLISVLEKTV